jgi:hypothetical protein
LVQVDQEFQLWVQSMGQGWVLHRLRECMVGQIRPMLAGEVMMERVWEVMPPPHFSVQVEVLDHPETLQSTGHAKALQLEVKAWAGQGMPQ